MSELKYAYEGSHSYTITLGPGNVQYLPVPDFLESNVKEWIDLLRGLSAHPQIKVPRSWQGTSPYPRCSQGGFDLELADRLISTQPWDTRLVVHHKLGILYRDHGLPTCVYYCFHVQLRLNAFEFDESVNSWVAETWNNPDLAESFVGVPEYLAFQRSAFIFRRTPFVLDRLKALTEETELEAKREREGQEARKASEDLEGLRKSRFSTYVYLIEDLRNRCFKIGRSATPGKRERTLQSEAPQVVLRFSIPADDDHEKQLHNQFSKQRVRGEWFTLGPDDLLWIVSFLKRNGDLARASVDYQWLGTICFSSSGGDQKQPK